MPDTRLAFVHEAELQLEPGTDPGAVGAAVTTALCGHWEHEGPCRWPHNNAIDASDAGTSFRTLFVASAIDEDEVRERIERSLRKASGWSCSRRARSRSQLLSGLSHEGSLPPIDHRAAPWRRWSDSSLR